MGKKIITVDDSASIRQALNFELTQAGYDVSEAEDGEDALSRLGDEKVDLVITDLNMPKVDGIELIQQLRSHPTHRFTPIIMLTTESEASKKNQAKEAGATAWMTKPFKPEGLLKVVKKVIG